MTDAEDQPEAVRPHATSEAQERIYQAGFDAAMVWQCVLWLPAALALSFVPLLWMVGLAGYFILLVAVPGLVLRWTLRYRDLDRGDEDVRAARGKIARAMVIWAALSLLTLLVASGLFHLWSGSSGSPRGGPGPRAIG